MSLFYDLFYRRYGIRKVDQLLNPPLPMLQLLELPKRSILHYVSTSALDEGPSSNDFLFRNLTKQIQLDHITEIGDSKGAPRKLSLPVEPMIRQFHLKNRRFFRMRSLESGTRDDNVLVVYNYGFMPKLYRYMRSIYSEYYKWWNIEAALWKNIAAVAKQTDRHQFVQITLPKTLPSVPELQIASKGVTQRFMKLFDSQQAWQMVELWKWFGEDRQQSLLAALPPEAYSRVNLVFQESGRWFVMNLGVLNQWRQTPKDEVVETPITSGFKADMFQRRFLKLLMVFMQVRTLGEGLDEAPVENTDPQATVVKQNPALPEVDPKSGAVAVKTQSTVVDDNDEHAEGADTRAEDIKLDGELEAQIDADLKELEKLNQAKLQEAEQETSVTAAPVVQDAEPEDTTLEAGVVKLCDRLADQGMLSAAEYRRYTQLAQSYKTLKAPDGKSTLEQFIKVDPEVLKIAESAKLPEIPTVFDKTMLKSSLLDFDKRYIEEVAAKDVAAMVLNLQHAGIAVTGYEVETLEDITGAYEAYTVKVAPVDGAASTLRFRLPKLQEDGTFVSGGVKYRVRKQRGDLPIRKVGIDRVALTSYYGKLFVTRSEKRVNNYAEWLRNAVMAKGLDDNDVSITGLQPANVFDNTFACPRIYSILAQGFRGFKAAGFDWVFDHKRRTKLFSEEILKIYEKDGSVVMGVNGKGQYLVADKDSALYVGTNGELVDLGSVESVLGLQEERIPVEFAEIKIMGRTMPVGLVLGYEMGLEKLMQKLRVTPRRVAAGSRVNLAEHEYSLVFSDETLVFSRDDKLASMVLAGFGEYHKALRNYSVYEFDKRGVYLNVLDTQGPSARYLREIDLLYQLFIDPITRDLLIEMKEPTNFQGLIMRSAELLLKDQHPDEIDPAHMRIKGYERLAGAVYTELVRSVRAHAGRPGKSKLPIDLNPYEVWRAISEDPSKSQVSDINPIENLKQVEAVTYSGTGGRMSRSMTKRTRGYHRNDMGTMSESTIDSGDVGINFYTSADPQFTSLRGISKGYEIGKTGATALLSTSALTAPGSDRDDPRRVNFVGIQNSHVVACKGYQPLALRTGYEQVIAHRTSDLFATTAKKAGRVLSVSEDGITVQYEDGEVKGYELGRRFGNAAGLVIPHSVVTDLKEGQKIAVGDAICYNEGFFEKDLLNPKNIVLKAGVMVKTALMEATVTLEDSSAISSKTAALLGTKLTKVKNILVNFDQAVRRLVKVGDQLEPEDILCIIEDAVTANSGLFDEESLDTLRVLSAQTPQAKAKGVVERIEVYYHGEKEDMSESLRALANASDRELAKRQKAAGKKTFTGAVNESFRIDGDPLQLDSLCIRVYITSDVPTTIGDKGVFCNQMKTVFGKVYSEPIRTESGQEIDAIFGAKSIADRIVLSPEIIGTTTTLLDVIAKKAIAAYRK